MASMRNALSGLVFLLAFAPSQAVRKVEVTRHMDSNSATTYKCGGLLSSSDACFPATFNIGVKKWLPCETQCKAGLTCSCPGEGSCSSVSTKNPGLRYIGGGAWGYNAHYSVRVNTETGEWDMLTSEDVWEGDRKIKKYSWVSPAKSKHEIKGTSYVDPSNVFTPNVQGDYCEPGVAGKYEEDLENKMSELPFNLAQKASYKCGGLMSSSDACFPATFNIGIKKWLPCETQCKAGLTCSCPGEGSCSSVSTKNPGLRYIGGGGYSAHYSVRVNTETGEWDMLTSEDVWEGDSKIKKYSWVSPAKSKHEIKGTSYVDPSNVFTPNVQGDYCEPGVAGKYEEDLADKMAELPW